MDELRKTARYYDKLLKSGRCDPDFFEFIRHIEAVSGGSNIGISNNFAAEPIRFGQIPYLHFPKTTIAQITERERLFIFVYFLGLTGNNGPLPLEFTSYAYQRMHNNYDHTLHRFLDIINHRFIGLFYRAWRRNNLAASLDNPDRDLITNIIHALSGMPIRDKTLPSDIEAELCGIFGCAIKSNHGLSTILKHYFNLPIQVLPHTESLSFIPVEYRCRLGKAQSVLGQSLQLGSRFFTITKKFTVEIGPIEYSKAKLFLPGATAFSDLVMLIQRYLDRPLEYDLRIILKSETVPDTRLNGKFQIGQSIWVGNIKKPRTYLHIGASRLAEMRHRKTNLNK